MVAGWLIGPGLRAMCSDLGLSEFWFAAMASAVLCVFTQPGIRIDLTVPQVAPVHAEAILDRHPLQLVRRRLYVTPQIEQITDVNTPHLVTYRRNARARRADRQPLATISAGGNHHGLTVVDRRGRAWHRMLTNRECARAQGFPDGTEAHIKRQIGNAVPVSVSRWLGTRAGQALAIA